MPDTRKSLRKTISAEIKLRRPGEVTFQVQAFDLSENGCRVEFIELPRPGEVVWVKFDGMDALESTVRWTRQFLAGLEFRYPIDGRVLDCLLPRLRGN